MSTMGLSRNNFTQTSVCGSASPPRDTPLRVSLTYDLPKSKRSSLHHIYPLDARGRIRPCSIEVRRQHHFITTDRMLATEAFKEADADRLPVVELKPFTKKEWRPAMSLPELEWDHRSYSGYRSSMSTRSLDFDYPVGYPDPDKQMTITPRVTNTSTCPKASSGHVIRRLQHPPIRDPTIEVNDYDHLFGFIPKPEREKSTLGEVRTGSNICTQFSCLKRALTEIDLRNQQSMQVSGKRIENLPPKLRPMYYDMQDYYPLTRSYTIPQDEPPDTMSSDKSQLMDKMQARVSGIETAYLDDTVYDAFDRSCTLPSIRVKRAPLKKRRTHRPHVHPASSSSSQRSSAHRSFQPGYRLGVTNSLDLMSHIGTPGGVEQQLSHRLKITIQNLRRSKDTGSIISGAYKIIPRFEASPAVEAQSSSRSQVNQSRISIGSQQNVTFQNPRDSKASSGPGSNQLDSGIETAKGFRSPSKARSRNTSSRAHNLSISADFQVTATIPTDTKGYASSDVSRTSAHPKDMETLMNKVQTDPRDMPNPQNTPKNSSQSPSIETETVIQNDTIPDESNVALPAEIQQDAEPHEAPIALDSSLPPDQEQTTTPNISQENDEADEPIAEAQEESGDHNQPESDSADMTDAQESHEQNVNEDIKPTFGSTQPVDSSSEHQEPPAEGVDLSSDHQEPPLAETSAEQKTNEQLEPITVETLAENRKLATEAQNETSTSSYFITQPDEDDGDALENGEQGEDEQVTLEKGVEGGEDEGGENDGENGGEEDDGLTYEGPQVSMLIPRYNVQEVTE